jgi:hypothetical protein
MALTNSSTGRDVLETVSRSLEALDGETIVDDHKARILSGYYWREESNYWKLLSKEIIQGNITAIQSSREKHNIRIDLKY